MTRVSHRAFGEIRCVAWRIVCATVAILCLLASSGTQPVWFTAHRAVGLHTAPSAPASGESQILDRAAFRLGNASHGFGWSTAIGDFNADGRPDAIVADRILPRASGYIYSYRIQFAMSGQAPEDVTFESSRDAVAITVSDVDSDNDLDLIARAALSGETVGLWLNDGHGHFTVADARQIPATVQATQNVGPTELPVAVSTLGLSSRRVGDALPAALDAARSLALYSLHSSPSTVPPATFVASLSRPRAPPQVSASFLS